MALTQLTKVDGRGINTTSDYRVGILTAVKFVGPFDGTGGNFAGVITATDGNFSGNVTIGGTLTYEDVTNIDSVGIVTAQKDIHVGAGLSVVGIVTTQKDIHVGAGLSVVGVATFSDHIILKGTNPRITFTDTDSNPDFQIYGSGGNLNIWDATNNASRLLINADGHIDVGHLDVLNGLSVGGNATFANDIDVDGHTNLDNVSIAGVTTIANNKELVFGEQADSQYNTLIKQIPSGSTGSLSVTTRFPRIYAHDTRIIDIDNGNTQAYFWPNQISLFATGNERLQITGSGIKVFGTADGHGILLDNTTNRNNITAESNRSGANNSILELDGKWNNTQVAFMTLSTGDDTTNKDDGRIRFFTKPSGGSITERLRLEPDGQVVFGGAGSRNVGFTHRLQIEDTNDTPHGFSMISNRANQYGPHMSFAKSRGSTRGSNTIVQDDDELATLVFRGADGTDLGTIGAMIDVRVDGTPASNKVPASFEFHTANSSGNLASRLIINSAGHLMPGADSVYNIGSSSVRFANVYADTYYGDGSNLTGIVADKIFEGNTEVETVDTGSDGHVKITTEGVESFRIDKRGYSSLGRDYSSNPGNGLVGITTIRGHRVNEAGDYAQLYFKNSSVSGGSSASIRAYRDGNNYSTGFSFYTRYSTSSGGDGNERFLINSTGTVVKQIFSSNQTYAANDTTQLGYQSQNLSDVTNTYTALRLTAGNSSPATAQLSSIRTGAGQNDFTIQLETGNTAFEAFRALSNGNFGFGIAAPTTQSGKVVHLHANGGQQRLHMTNNTTGSTATDGFEIIVNEGTETHVRNFENGNFRISTGGSASSNEAIRIKPNGSVNIGGDLDQTTYKLKVTGSFAATTKSFVIDHPTKEKHKLRYACLEGPENSVYVRGKTSDSVIELPDYWTGLVHEDSITVNVTPIGNHKVWVESINNNSVTIGSDGSEYFYTVFAERKDVDKLEVEVEE